MYASDDEGNLIQAANMVLSEQDTQWAGDAGGSVGLLSYQANVRFVNFSAGSPAHAEMADFARLAGSAKELDGITKQEVDNVPTDSSVPPSVTDGVQVDVDVLHTNGKGSGQIWIAGARLDANTTIMLGRGIAGGQSPQSIQLANGTNIDEFSTDGTLAGNSDSAVPTEKAVKTYVDNVKGVVEFIRTSDLSIPATTWTWLDYDVTGQSAGTTPVSRTSSGVYTAQFEGHFSLDISYQFYHGYTSGATFYYFVYIYDSGSTEQVRMTGTFDTRYSTNTKWGHKAFSFYMGAGWYVRPRIYLNQATAGNIQPSLYTSMQFGGIRC